MADANRGNIALPFLRLFAAILATGECRIDPLTGMSEGDYSAAYKKLKTVVRITEVTNTKCYVRFTMTGEGRPWHEEVTIWVGGDAEPLKVVGLLVGAREAHGRAVSAELDLALNAGRPIKAASYFVAQAPHNLYFHSRRVATPKTTDPNHYQLAVLNAIGQPTGDCPAPLVGFVEFFYQVWCVNSSSSEKTSPDWEVEVLQRTEAFSKEPRVENLNVAHERQPLTKLHETVQRLANFARLGGDAEKPF